MLRRLQQIIYKFRLPCEGIVTEFSPNCSCLEDRVLYSAGPFEVPDSSVNLQPNLDFDSILSSEPVTEPFLLLAHSAHSTAFQQSTVDSPELHELRELLITDRRVDHIDQLVEDIERLRNSTDIASDASQAFDEMLDDNLEQIQPLDAATKSELIIVDRSVAGYYNLINDIIVAAGSDRTFEIAYLDADRNGVEQITQLLSDYQNLDAAHLISHGSDGELALGSERLNQSNLDFYSAQISQWSSSFAKHGDFLVYGCNLAESQSGIVFLERLSEMMGTDLAASQDLTGSANLGGDWILEYSTGQVESNLIFTDSIHTAWSGLLATVVVDTTSDYDNVDARYGDTSSIDALLADKGSDNRISLREAIDAANRTINGASMDEIHFNIPDNDARHFYYRDNGVAGSLSLVVATTLNDAVITDFDPDYPYAAHSWFSINWNNSLPDASITDAVFINGYTQPGATQNTLAAGHNAQLRIEVTSSGNDNMYGLHFATGADSSTLRGLAINDVDWSGVMIDYGVANVTLQGNFIGTDITGTLDRGNGDTGIQIRGDNAQIGGANAADRNVISGSNNRGIALFSGGTLTGTVIENNFIGVDATGLNDLGNNTAGIQVYNSDQGIIRNNVISGNAGHGIWFRNSNLNTNNTVQGNYIGLGADGSTVIANDTNGITIEEGSNNTIGGSGVGEGNVISGNTGNGILLDSSSATSNTIIGNLIGTDAAGTANRGNGSTGILLKNNASDNVIGGTLAGEGNKIAFSGGSGVGITQNGTDRNAIRGNRIYSNAGLGIDLNEDGVSANDPGDGDSSENQMQNFPVLTSAGISGSVLTITGSLNSTPTTLFNIDFFASTTADGSGHGQAERYLGSATGLSTNGLGNLALNVVLSGVSVSAGEFITATATDQNGNTSEFALNVVAVAINSSPIITSNGGGATANINIAEGTTAVTTVTANDADLPGDTLTYSITGGADAALFNINPSSGVLAFISARDFETPTDANLDGIYQVQVTVNDGNLGTDVQTINVTVTDANDAPIITSNGGAATASINVAEGTTAVTTVTASDVDLPADMLTYTITGGADASLFDIDLTTGALIFLSARDFETPTDADLDGIYQVQVTVNDGNLGTDVQTISVNVTSVGTNPTITSNGGGATANVNVNENSTTVTTVTATDPDDAPLIYSIAGGNDAGMFIIHATTGELSFFAAPDFELPGDFDGDNIYEVEILVEDAIGLADNQLIAVTIGPRNDNAPAFTNSTAVNVAEGTTAVVTVSATDADDPGDTLSYAIVGGTDASRFTINGVTGQLSFVAAPDFESPVDANGDNVYEVMVRANDGVSLTSDQVILVTVIPVNEFDPVFTTPSTFVRLENMVPSFVVGASDSDSPSNVTYSLSANPATDNALFTIDSSTGVVTGLFLANYEAPLDSDADNFYVIEVIANDGFGRTSSQVLTLEIVDMAEYPVVGNDSFAVNEGMTYVSATGELLINDNEFNGLALSTSLVSGPANGSLLLGSDGTFIYVHDGSETTTDSFVYRSTSAAGLSTTGVVTIAINPMQNTTIVANDAVVMPTNTTIIIDPSTLLANDFDIDSSVFNVIPLAGSEVNGTVLVDGAGRLVFIPSPAFIGTASFQYVVVADGVTSGPATVVVEVISPAVIPPKEVPKTTDNDDTEDEEELEISNDATAPIQRANNGPTSAETKTSNDFAGETTNLKTLADDFEAPIMAESELPFPVDTQSIFYASHSKFQRNVNLRALSDIDSNIEKIASWIWQDLNELNEKLLNPDGSAKFWSVMTPTVTTGLSVGYMMWLIKGGQLMAGLMAQVPAWKLIAIDPLPILKSLEDDDEQDSDSLASLVDNGDQSDSQQEPSEIVMHENLAV